MNLKLHHKRVTGFQIWGMSITLLLALVPLLAMAETVVRTGSSVSVEVNQTVENDFYAAGGTVTHSGEIKGDMTAAAGSLTINGEVGVDLNAVGGSIQVHAPIGDDLRLISGETVIGSDVGGDVFVLSGTLRILSSAKIGGNVYFYGGNAEISGPVAGAIMGQAESFSINSEVGSIDVTAVDVELLDGAVVAGDVSYSATRELSRASGASVGGEITRGASRSNETDTGSSFPYIFFAIWLFTSFCFFLLFKPMIESVLESVKKDTLKVGVFGAVAAIVGPIVGIVLMATVLGVWLGILKMLFTIMLFIITMMVLPITTGGFALSFWKPHRRLDAVTVLAGMAIVVVLSLIPVVGAILIFLGYVVTLGAILYLLYQKGRGLI